MKSFYQSNLSVHGLTEETTPAAIAVTLLGLEEKVCLDFILLPTQTGIPEIYIMHILIYPNHLPNLK